MVPQERLNSLMEERQRLVESSSSVSQSAPRRDVDSKSAGGSEMLDMEAARLDLLRRRQQREYEQLAKHEQTRKAMQVGSCIHALLVYKLDMLVELEACLLVLAKRWSAVVVLPSSSHQQARYHS